MNLYLSRVKGALGQRGRVILLTLLSIPTHAKKWQILCLSIESVTALLSRFYSSLTSFSSQLLLSDA